jgi:DNA polymerase I
MLKLAMLDIDAKVREYKLQGSMILQVHDELVFDIPKNEVEVWEKIVRESMERVIENHSHATLPDSRLKIHDYLVPPIRVDMHSGENWVAAKG